METKRKPGRPRKSDAGCTVVAVSMPQADKDWLDSHGGASAMVQELIRAERKREKRRKGRLAR